MERQKRKQNTVSLVGEVVSAFALLENSGERAFYQADLAVGRLSGAQDILPITIPEELFLGVGDVSGRLVAVKGWIRSFFSIVNGRRTLQNTVAVEEIEVLEDGTDRITENHVFLSGFLRMEPVLRKTTHGRYVTDLLVEVPRAGSRFDSISCIAWRDDAYNACALSTGDAVRLWGRAQSRDHEKSINGERMTRRIFEVSAFKLEAKGRTADEVGVWHTLSGMHDGTALQDAEDGEEPW